MIRRQQRLLLSFGESPVLDLDSRGSLEKSRGGQKDPWDGTKSNIGVKIVDEVEVGEEHDHFHDIPSSSTNSSLLSTPTSLPSLPTLQRVEGQVVLRHPRREPLHGEK